MACTGPFKIPYGGDVPWPCLSRGGFCYPNPCSGCNCGCCPLCPVYSVAEFSFLAGTPLVCAPDKCYPESDPQPILCCPVQFKSQVAEDPQSTELPDLNLEKNFPGFNFNDKVFAQDEVICYGPQFEGGRRFQGEYVGPITVSYSGCGFRPFQSSDPFSFFTVGDGTLTVTNNPQLVCNGSAELFVGTIDDPNNPVVSMPTVDCSLNAFTIGLRPVPGPAGEFAACCDFCFIRAGWTTNDHCTALGWPGGAGGCFGSTPAQAQGSANCSEQGGGGPPLGFKRAVKQRVMQRLMKSMKKKTI